MVPTVTINKAKKNLDAVLTKADEEAGVWIKKGQLLYHVHREVSEKELLNGLRESARQFKAGEARVLRSLADLD
ncbi:hypothetical protein HY065_00920 [Candidatus Berkelbacteria bacterium]|nr:hypothetical protein [Candidatus Berkelbacteria bacterium]